MARGDHRAHNERADVAFAARADRVAAHGAGKTRCRGAARWRERELRGGGGTECC